MNVLILGANGYLGPHLVKALEPHYRLRLSDIKPAPTRHPFMHVDVSSLEQVRAAAKGMDAIVNLSVLRNDRQLAFDVSMRGCYNMMQAAVEHGIRRVINTGPHSAIAGPTYEQFDFDLNPDIPPHPGTNLYALTKSLGQEICKVFTENYDIYVLCFLFCSFRDPDDLPQGTDAAPFSVSWGDASQAIRLGLQIDLARLPSRCEVFNLFSDMPHHKFANEKAKRLLGFQPQDDLSVLWQKAPPEP